MSTTKFAGFFGTLRPSGLAGLAWGGLLIWRGPAVFEAVQGRGPSDGEQDATVILAARHLGQGVLQLLVPRHLGHLYAGIDFIHAASMVALAVKDRDRARACLVSGGVAALSGALALRAARVQAAAS